MIIWSQLRLTALSDNTSELCYLTWRTRASRKQMLGSIWELISVKGSILYGWLLREFLFTLHITVLNFMPGAVSTLWRHPSSAELWIMYKHFNTVLAKLAFHGVMKCIADNLQYVFFTFASVCTVKFSIPWYRVLQTRCNDVCICLGSHYFRCFQKWDFHLNAREKEYSINGCLLLRLR